MYVIIIMEGSPKLHDCAKNLPYQETALVRSLDVIMQRIQLARSMTVKRQQCVTLFNLIADHMDFLIERPEFRDAFLQKLEEFDNQLDNLPQFREMILMYLEDSMIIVSSPESGPG